MKTKTIIALLTAAFTGSLALAESGVPKDYPLKKCPVSDEALGGGKMKAFKVTHEGTDVWLCCKSCKEDFDKDAAKFTKMVKDAAPKK